MNNRKGSRLLLNKKRYSHIIMVVSPVTEKVIYCQLESPFRKCHSEGAFIMICMPTANLMDCPERWKKKLRTIFSHIKIPALI